MICIMDFTIEDFLDSPFEPGKPVSPDNFKGRINDCKKIIRSIPKVIHTGVPQHFFITGKRGMGKTSFAKYVSRVAEDNFNMIPIHINNGGGTTVDELIQKLLEALFDEFDKDYLGKNLVNLFVDNVSEVKFAGSGFSLKNEKKLIQDVKNNFAKFLIKTCENLPEGYGIFILIDDINGLSDNIEFTNWYKGFFESIDFNEEYVPAVFTLISYPKEFDNLCNINESFSRMFQLIEIDNLEDEEIEEFFIDTFNEFNIEFVDEKAVSSLVYYSWGMPLIMQQIGDSVFWNVQDDFKITEEIALTSIIDAAEELGKKQIKSKLNKIRSDHYEDIFIELGRNKLITFKKSEVKKLLSPKELKVFDSFLIRAKELNILESVGKENSGEYAFVNRLYFTYFMIMSIREELYD